MVRAYAVRGKKRKNREESYERDETSDGEEEGKEVVNELEGIQLVPTHHNNTNKARFIFILQNASLEVAKVGKLPAFELGQPRIFLKRNNRNPADYRPDIVHQALLTILDSQLNKSGMVRAVYVRTEKGVLFEVKPHARLPRTFKHFCGLMLQLLQKLSINAVGKREKLLRVIKNPVSRYLPVNSHKIGLSHSSDKLVNINNCVDSIGSDVDTVFVVGAMAYGKIDREETDDFISISSFPLSAAYCIGKITNALETKYNIL